MHRNSRSSLVVRRTHLGEPLAMSRYTNEQRKSEGPKAIDVGRTTNDVLLFGDENR